MMVDRFLLRWVQLWVVALFLFPTDVVIRPLGGQAHMANLLGVGLVAAWIVGGLLPGRVRPGATHVAITLVWLATLAAWVALARRGADVATWNAAERWLMVILAFSGVALVIADGIDRLDHLHRLAATAVFAAASASVVAVVQWRTSIDPSGWLRRLPGFTLSGDGVDTVVRRGEIGRVTGTALHPIEFGVGAALMLPLAVHLLIHDHRRHRLRRVIPLGLCALAVPLSVSRSAVVVTVMTVGVMVWLMPPLARLTAVVTAPALAGVALLATPGAASTLVTSFVRASDDSSIQARVDDISLVSDLVTTAPWWGRGGGTYLPRDVFEILDNQYFLSLIELGVVGGMMFVVATLVVPLHMAARNRRRAVSPLMGSLAGVGLATTWGCIVAWATFDAWAFPRFVGIGALVLGLLGSLSHLPAHQPEESSLWTC